MNGEIIKRFGIETLKARTTFLLRCLLVLLSVGSLVRSVPAGAELPPYDNFSYAVRIQLPLREKYNIGSGFYFNHGGSTYLVTARHVLFAPTRVRVKDGAALAIPRHLLHRIRYHKASRLLALEGVLSAREKEDMLKHPSINESGRQTIRDLYEKSQRLVLKAHEATVVTCAPGTGELDLRLTAMSIKGFIKYHPVQDVAVVRLGGPTGFVSEIQVTKQGKLTALEPADLKPVDDVAPGNQVFILGFTYPGKQETSLKVRRPLLTKGTIGGISKVLGLIALDCAVSPGDSGGLVLQEIDEGPRGKHLKGIGLISGGFRYQKNGQDSKDYALAIPLDALVELLDQ